MYQYKLIIPFLLIFLSFQSCYVGKKYIRDTPEFVTKDMYRNDLSVSDTTNIAQIDWQNFFTDPFLKKYIQIGIDNNLNLLQAIERIKASNAYYKQSKSQYYPSVSAGVEAGFNSPSLNTAAMQNQNERTTIMQYGIPVYLSWEADIWGKMNSSEKAMKAELMSTTATAQAIQSMLVANIAGKYYQLLVLDEQKKITENTLKIRSENIKTTQALKDAGTLTEVAVVQSRALYYNTQGILININHQIKLIENSLSILLGKSPRSIERMRLDQQNIQHDLAYGVPLELLSNRPDIKAAEYNVIRTFELTNVAMSEFYPSFKITAGTGLQSNDFDELFSVKSIFINVIAGLTQPIWNKRQIRTNYEIAKSNQQSAYLNYKESILTAAGEVSNALIDLDSKEQLMQVKSKEIAAYNSATEYSRELVNYGMANYLEVLRSEENELYAQLAYLDAYYGKLLAWVELYRALGGGWQ